MATEDAPKENRKFPVVVRPPIHRAADWPILHGLQTFEEYVQDAEVYCAEAGEQLHHVGRTGAKLLMVQLSAEHSLAVMSTLQKLAHSDQQWANAPKMLTEAIVEIISRYGAILDEAQRISQERIKQEAAEAAAEPIITESLEELSDGSAEA